MKKILTYYFRHDFTAQDDDKIIEMRMVHGWEGYGLFWALIEILAQSGGTMSTARLDQIAYRLRAERTLLHKIIHNFGLFELDGETISNTRLTDFLNHDLMRRRKMRENALKRGVTATNDALVVPTPTKKRKRAVKPSNEVAEIQLPFDTVPFRAAWQRWTEYRKGLRKPYKSVVSEQAALNQLKKYNEPFALDLIERSIANGWQGLVFEGTDKAFELFTEPLPITRGKHRTPERNTFNGLTAN